MPDQNDNISPPKPPNTESGVNPLTDASAIAEPPVLNQNNSEGATGTKGSSFRSASSYFKSFLVPIIGVFVALAGISVGVGLVTQQSGKKVETSVANTPPPSHHLQEIKSRGTLRIGTDATYPPMEFPDSQGNLTGYDVELGAKIAEKLNVQPEFRNIAWDKLFTTLESGEVDILISAITITEERKVDYTFSDQYLTSGQVLVIKKDNDLINSVNDLADKRVGVQMETTNENEALKYTADELVLRFDSFIEATRALQAGEVDTVITDLPNAKDIITKNPDLKIAGEPLTNEPYGIVFKKGDTEFANEVDSVIKLLRQQGVLAFLKQKWLE